MPRLGSPTDAQQKRARWARDARRLARRYRRWVGAGLVGLSLLLALNAVAPSPGPTVAVAVATRDLPAGTSLARDDIGSVRLPAAVAPSTSLARSELEGRVLAGPVAAGEQLTTSRLGGGALLVGAPPGTVALPVRVADPGAAALVSAGDRVDVLAAVSTSEGTAVRTVGRDLPVLRAGGSVGPGGDAALDPLGTGAGADDLLGGLLVLAAGPDDVEAIVAGAAQAPLSLVIRPLP